MPLPPCAPPSQCGALTSRGIGDAALLGTLGVPVLHHAPAVGENLQDHVQARLRYVLAAPLGLKDEGVTFHVLEAISVASAILEYTAENRVDHILLAARPPSARRRWLGSVSAEVAEKAECSVTVVRPRRGARESN